jgi:3-methylcrotonyl-CoA carboxylase beta subunit
VVPADAKPFDVREVIARLVDGSVFDEFKALFGTTLVCGLRTCTATRSRSSPTTASCSPKPRKKARTSSSWPASAAFRCCSCRTSPASWSAEIRSRRHRQARRQAGDRRGLRQGAEIHRDHRRQLRRRQLRHVRRAYDPRFLWMWPNARIGVMGAEQAAGVLVQVKREQAERSGSFSAEEEAEIKQPILDQYEPGPPLLFQRPPVGRRRHRPGADPRRAGLACPPR